MNTGVGKRREHSDFTLRKALSEVFLDLVTRLSRTLLTALGTAIGIAVLVATLGLAASAGANITNHFDELAVTDVTVTANPVDEEGDIRQSFTPISRLQVDASLQIQGVEAAGRIGSVPVGHVAGLPVVDPSSTNIPVKVFAATPGLSGAISAEVEGTFISSAHNDHGYPVGVVGRAVASELGVGALSEQPVVFIDDQPISVIGILRETERKPELLSAVVVPEKWAANNTAFNGGEEILVKTRIGAADIVVEQLPLALSPHAPEVVSAKAPPTPTLTRDRVSNDTQGLLIALATISLVVGGIGIANVTLVSVMERTSEIGLRRALGATRAHIMLQFLLESIVTGTLGAIVGASAGVFITVTSAIANEWPPVVNPVIPLLAPIVGAVIGLAAGGYPAWRAGRVQPILALRSGGQ